MYTYTALFVRSIVAPSVRRRHLLATTVLAVAWSAAVPGGAQAQVSATPEVSPQVVEQQAAEPASGQDIVVTASKRQQNINDVPESITAISGDQLVSKGIATVQDLQKVTPGLSYVESGRSIPVFSVRGVGFFDTSIASRPTVSVYLDEAPIPFSVEAKGSAFDLERVEVLKGPQGTLFGQNSTGGAINFIAAKPTAQFEAGGTASYGTFNTGDVQAYVSGPLSSTLEGRLAVRTVQSGDYQESYTRDAHLGAQHFTQARLLLDWRPVERLKISLNANGFHDGSDTQAAQFKQFVPSTPARAGLIPLLANYPTAPRNDRAADWNPGEDYASHNSFYQTIGRADFEVSRALTITSLTTYSHERIDQLVDADGTALSNIDVPVRGSISTFSEELRAAGEIKNIQYIVGASYEHDRTNENDIDDLRYSTTAFAIAPPPVPPLDILGILTRQRFNTTAVFGNVDYHLLDKITLHGGVRFTQADLDYAACTTGQSANAAAALTILTNSIRGRLGAAPIPPLQQGQCGSIDATATPALAVGTFNQHNVSWRTGVDFKPRPGVLLYFNVSKGYKAGSVEAAPSNLNVQYTPVTQEAVLAYEAGAKASFFDKRLEITGAAFYYQYTNKQVLGRQVFQPNIFGPINTLINVPHSHIRGLEGQATVRPLRGLSLTLAGTYLVTKVIGDFQNFSILGTPVNYRGDAFPYTPRYQVVADGEYRHSIFGNKAAFIGANANYRSQTTAGFGNEPALVIPGYTLLDLRLGVERNDGKWRVEIYGRNITNAYYYTNIARSQDVVRAYTGMPRTYGLRVAYKY